jgi:hypothetical protein
MDLSRLFEYEEEPKRVLDFDIENRPLSYWYDGATTAEITAIAACWVGEPDRMKVWLLGIHKPVAILENFRKLYDQADVVIGHNIRRHDLPIINAGMLEYHLPPLSPKMTADTQWDLVKKKDLSSSLEVLAEMFGLETTKQHMSTFRWREANRLKRAGIADAKSRAVSDVQIHMELYPKLVEGGYLKSPKLWRP